MDAASRSSYIYTCIHIYTFGADIKLLTTYCCLGGGGGHDHMAFAKCIVIRRCISQPNGRLRSSKVHTHDNECSI